MNLCVQDGLFSRGNVVSRELSGDETPLPACPVPRAFTTIRRFDPEQQMLPSPPKRPGAAPESGTRLAGKPWPCTAPRPGDGWGAHSDDHDQPFRSIATTCYDRSRPGRRGAGGQSDVVVKI